MEFFKRLRWLVYPFRRGFLSLAVLYSVTGLIWGLVGGWGHKPYAILAGAALHLIVWFFWRDAQEDALPVGVVDPYAGDALTQNFEGLMPRQEGETDWAYRQRLFPEVYMRGGFSSAVSVLMGHSVTKLTPEEIEAIETLPTPPIPLKQMNGHDREQFIDDLKRFADDISEDPVGARV